MLPQRPSAANSRRNQPETEPTSSRYGKQARAAWVGWAGRSNNRPQREGDGGGADKQNTFLTGSTRPHPDTARTPDKAGTDSWRAGSCASDQQQRKGSATEAEASPAASRRGRISLNGSCGAEAQPERSFKSPVIFLLFACYLPVIRAWYNSYGALWINAYRL